MEQTDNPSGAAIVEESERPIVSVIVASHRPEYIESLGRMFNETICGSIASEVIFVTDYNHEQYLGALPQIRWLFHDDKNIAAKRNRGIAVAHGEYCAFIDDDCIPQAGWIINAVRFLKQNPECAGVEGLTVIERTANATGAYREYKRLERQGYRTNNIFYRREAVVAAGMFDERFVVQREDVDLAYTLLERGHTIGYDTSIRVVHRFRRAEKWDLLKNCINRRYDPLLYKKHKLWYRRHIHIAWPRAIALMFLIHSLLLASLLFVQSLTPQLLIGDAVLLMVLTFRRAGVSTVGNPLQAVRDFISFALAPLVLFGALLYGSIRFRYVFLI